MSEVASMIGLIGGIPVAGWAGAWLAMYVRSKSRDQVDVMRKEIRVEMEQMLDVKLARFQIDLLEKLNGRYVFADGSRVTGPEIVRRIERLENGRMHGRSAGD
jgi:hypothetical protein